MSGRIAYSHGKPVRENSLPIFTLKLTEQDLQAVQDVLLTGHISRGSLCENFEQVFCEYTGAQYSIVLTSGTAALHLALKALDLKHGDEIIVPSFSFVATALAVEYSNLTPVFAEIEPDTYNISVEDVQRRITHRTKGLIPVHYAGQPADLTPLLNLARKHDLYLIEDAAHAIGSTYKDNKIGNIGHLSAFSMFASKNMTSGEGGIVTTNNPQWAEHIRMMRAHGIVKLDKLPNAPGLYDVSTLGYNYHLSNLNIALAIEQLKRLDENNLLRKEKAMLLSSLLADTAEIELPRVVGDHIFHLYTIRLGSDRLVAQRNDIIEALIAEGIQVGVYYRPIHLFSYFKNKYAIAKGSLPITEKLSDSIITLPMYPLLTEQDLRDVAAALKKVIWYFMKKT